MQQYADEENIDIFPNKKLFRISFDPRINKMRIVSRYNGDLNNIREYFSEENKNAFFVKQYGYCVENKLYAINKFGYFSSGLFLTILKYIKQNYGNIGVVAISENCKNYIKDYITPLKDWVSKINEEEFEPSNISETITPRAYQDDSIKSLICDGFGKGLIEIPTAGGKSLILANFIYTLEKQYKNGMKYLVFVPNRQLVDQMYKDFIEYGFDKNNITRFTAGLKKSELFNPNCQIIIANRQYVFNNEDKLPNTDVLICDECHQIAPDSRTYEFVEKCNSKIKIGCSGTIPKEKFKKWSLIGLFGNIVYFETITNLQNSGFISKLKITSLQIIDKYVESDRNLLFNRKSIKKYKEDETDVLFNDAYNSEINYIMKNYLKLYKPLIEQIKNEKGNILLLFDRIEIGKSIYELISESNIRDKSKVFYIDGTIKVDDRESVRNIFESSTGNILCAQAATTSTGINIKNLTTIVFVFNTKSTSRVLQSIGRTLRLHSSKEYAHLIDTSMNFKYSHRQMLERFRIYKESYNKPKPDEIIEIEV